MGNYRFRLSDMMPNAWFYKLKDMNKSRNQQNIIYHNHVSKKKPHHTSSSSSSFSSSSSSSFPSSLSSKERQQQQQQQQQLSDQRKSYYFSRDLSTTTAAPAPAPAPPPGAEHDNAEMKTTRNADGKSSSSKKKRSGARRNRVSNRGVTTTSSSVATAGGCSFRATVKSVWSKPDSTTPEEYPISALDTTTSSSSSDQNETFTLPEFASNNMNIPCFAPEKFDTMLSWSSSTYCRGSKLEKKDTKNKPAIAKFQEPADDKGNGIGIGIDTVSQFNLRPIITNHQSSKTTSKKMESLTSLNATAKVEEPTKIRRDCGGPATARKFSSGNYSSQGLKLRTNSPRIVSRRRIQLQGRKSVSKSRSRRSMSESFAVVKSSKDPQRDFRDSMVEMIIENNLCASKDLEDLLACYLSLNSDEYHDLIITVFKQIWFDIIDIHPN